MAYCEISQEGDVEVIEWEESMREKIPNGACLAWFHSHVNMGVSPSSTDDKQFSDLKKDQPVYIRIIMNKRFDLNISISIDGFMFHSIPYSIINHYDSIFKEVYKKIDEHNKLFYPKTTSIYSGKKSWEADYNRAWKQDTLIDYQTKEKKTPAKKKTKSGHGLIFDLAGLDETVFNENPDDSIIISYLKKCARTLLYHNNAKYPISDLISEDIEIIKDSYGDTLYFNKLQVAELDDVLNDAIEEGYLNYFTYDEDLYANVISFIYDLMNEINKYDSGEANGK